MRSLFWNFLGNPHPAGAIIVALDAKAKLLDAPKDMRWADVQKKISTDATAISIQ